jgi:hypothetical protein
MSIGNRPPTAWFTSDRMALAGLLLFTVIVRGGALWAMRANLEKDPDAYREIAENLLRYGAFALGTRPIYPTAYRPPLYPIVLSNLPGAGGHNVSLVKVAALHVMLGVASVWLTYLTARRLSVIVTGPAGLKFAAIFAGLLIASDPILLNQQTLLMTETLASLLAIVTLWCLARFDADQSWFNAALAGGAIGLAVLCRPTFLPWFGLVGIAMLAVRGRNSELSSHKSGSSGFGWRIANVVAMAIAAAAVISPWATRNYRASGKPIVTTTHGGYTFALANNKDFYLHLRSDESGLPWTPSDTFPGEVLAISQRWALAGKYLPMEVAEDQALYELAWRDIKNDYPTFYLACLYRIRQLWSPLPHRLTADESMNRQLLRYATCAWYLGVYALAAVGVWRLGWRLLQPPWLWGVLLCVAFTAVHTFYWTNMRMRAPLMPIVAVVAAAGAAQFISTASRLPPA